MKSKICSKCDTEKDLDEFLSNKKTLDRKSSWCKSCNNIVSKKYYLKHREEIKIKTRKYSEKHKEKRKRYNFKNRERINIQKKNYYLKNIGKIKIRRKIWNENNREKIKIRNKKYDLEHKDEKNNYRKQQRKINNKFGILCNLRTRVWSAINGNNKSMSTMFLIGCEIDYLLFHLQLQFTKDMNWDNYGRKKGIKCWEVDHIKPCAKFDLRKADEQHECFNYKNLQPLWAKDNKIKSAKYGK